MEYKCKGIFPLCRARVRVRAHKDGWAEGEGVITFITCKRKMGRMCENEVELREVKLLWETPHI
jgi:hypothetical protein